MNSKYYLTTRRRRIPIKETVLATDITHHKRQDVSLTASSVLARNATLNLITEGWIFLVLLFAIPKLVFFLGEASFGLFSLAWVVVGYLAFLDIGVSSATTKFVSEYLARQRREEIGSLIRTALAANSVMGLVAGLVALSIAPLLVRHAFKIPTSLHGQALTVFLAVACALPVLLIQGVLRGALSSYQRFDWLNLVNGAVMSLQWGLMTVLAWKGCGVLIVVWVAVVARAVAGIIYLSLLLRLVPNIYDHLSLRWNVLRQLMHFGIWVSVSQIMSPLLVYMDRMMIAGLVSLQAVTIYTIPTEIFNRLGILPSCLMATLFPAFSGHAAVGEAQHHLQRLYNSTTRYLLLALLPFFTYLVVFAQDILSVWMGPHFAQEGSLVLQILAIGALLNFLARLPFGAVQAVGQPDVAAKCHLLELPIYAALCFLLIPRWGIVGAACACTLRVLLDSFLMFWVANKYCLLRPSWIKDVGPLVGINALLAACLEVAVHAVQGTHQRLLLGIVFLLFCYLAVWWYALKKEDKPAIVRTLRLAMQKGS